MLQRLPALALLAASLPDQAGRLLDMETVDRASGQTLETYRHRGRHWVAGHPGERYAVRRVNRSGERVLVVLPVDGVNAVSGETAAPDQSGYVLDARRLRAGSEGLSWPQRRPGRLSRASTASRAAMASRRRLRTCCRRSRSARPSSIFSRRSARSARCARRGNWGSTAPQ